MRKMVGRLCCSAFKGFTGKSLRETPQNLILRTDQKHFRQGIESKDESIKACCKAAGTIDKLPFNVSGLEPTLPVIFFSSWFKPGSVQFFNSSFPSHLMNFCMSLLKTIAHQLHLSPTFLGPHIHVNTSICHFLLPVIIIEIYWDKMGWLWAQKLLTKSTLLFVCLT